MKTAVVVHREFRGVPIRQDSKNGFLCVNDLYQAYISTNPETKKQLAEFFRTNQTKEFAEVIRESMIVQQNENMDKSTYLGLPLLEPLEVIRTRRGKYGGTWVHPYIFLDFAMWLSPVFKMWAMGVIEDKLIEIRNEAGDRHNEMAASLKKIGAVSPREYAMECVMLNTVVFGSHKKEIRNHATQDQLDLLNKLQKFNAHLISTGMSHSAREKECKQFAKIYNFVK